MLPDSKIAQSSKYGETKIKHVIQFGIAAFVKEQMIRDFKLLLFSLKFEETTGSQAKKQYDGYAQFCPNENRKLSVGCYTST